MSRPSERLLARFVGSRFRVALVVSIAIWSLATSVPNYLLIVFPIYGHFGFISDENWRVEASFRPLLKVGDVIDWRALPFAQRYDAGDFSRLAPTGTRVVFPVIRSGARLNIPLVSEYHKERFGLPNGLWLYGLKKSAELLIVLLGTALVLVRPTRLSWLFFVYAAGLASDGPIFWSFLPASLYVALSFIGVIFALPLAPVALVFFALALPDQTSSGWRAALQRASPYLFLVLAALWVAAIAREQFAILQGAWLLNTAIAFNGLAWTASFVILLIQSASAWRAHMRPLSWACEALAASAFCYMFIDGGSLAPVDLVPYPDYPALLSLLLSLAAVYPIVRGRIIDVRFIVTRAALSAGIAYSLVLAFALLNLVFGSQIARVAYVIPIEILAAVLFGFRLSGLQDVAAALNLTNAGQAARIRGDRSSERDMLARALARAERTRNPSLIATVRAHSAFGAWFAGDDKEFESNMQALEKIVGDKPMRGLHRFAKSASRAFVNDPPKAGELPEWTARSCLVACAASDDSIDAKNKAASAIAAADASADPFLQALARAALAEFDGENRRRLYDEALSRCETAGAGELGKAVRAILMGKQQFGLLDAFVARLRVQRPTRPTLDVRFADATVRSQGVPIKLHPREFALLFLVAETRDGAPFDTLSDVLWPELDGDAARNALRVCLHRLRKALGDDAAVGRAQSRYRLRDGAIVDLWNIQELVDSCLRARVLNANERQRLSEIFETLHSGGRSRPTELDWFARIERTIERLMRNAGQRLAEDALERGDYDRAAFIATVLLDQHPLDEMARGLAIRSRGRGVKPA